MVANTSGRDIDKGWAWLVLFASYVNLLLCSGLAFVAGMFQLVFLEQFQGSVALTSWITALFSSFMQLGGPLSSVVSNCFNCRTAVMLGGALLSIGMFAGSLANNLELLFVTFGLIAGLGLGLTYTASIVVVNYFFLERRTLVTGIALSASGFGIVISPQIARFLFDNFAWRETLVITAGASAHICVTGALMSSMHEAQGKSGIFQKCFSCVPWFRFQTSNLAYERGHEIDEEQKAMMQIESSERPVTDMEDHHCAKDEILVGSNSYSNISHLSSRKIDAQEMNQNSLVTPDASGDHRAINPENKDSSSELLQRGDNDAKISVFVDTSAGKTKAGIPSSEVFELNDRKNFLRSCDLVTHSGSHQELMSKPLLQKALEKASDIYSQRDLIFSRMGDPSITQSNPNFIHRLAAVQSSTNTGVSRTSLNSGKPGSCCSITVVSRNPSLLGLVPSTSHLDVVNSTAAPKLPDANCMLESRVILTGSSLSMKKEMSAKDVNKVEDDNRAASKTSQPEFPSLFRNKCFWLLCTCLFIENAGCGIFNMHLASFAHSKGLTDQQLTNILSVNGFAVLFGRCMCGALANAIKGSGLLIWWALHVLGGLALCLLPFVGQSYVSMVILVYCVGNYYGSVYTVLSSLTIEMVGLTNLATAFGIEMVCAGFSFLISPPLAGVLVDLTNSYDTSMFIGGLFLITGGMTVLLIPLLGLQRQHDYTDDIRREGDSPDLDAEDVK